MLLGALLKHESVLKSFPLARQVHMLRTDKVRGLESEWTLRENEETINDGDPSLAYYLTSKAHLDLVQDLAWPGPASFNAKRHQIAASN